MKKLLWKDIKPHGPCVGWTEDRYAGIFPQGATILEVLQSEHVPDKDKIWLYSRMGIASERNQRLLAVFAARRVEHILIDQRSKYAINVAERYANGEASEEELSAALDAAWDAARDAARDADRDAAWAARTALDAARDAAWDAAWAAAWDAAWDAAWAAARAAAWASFVKKAIELETENQY